MTTSTSKNDITGALIKTKASTEKYRDGWDAIFGKQEKAWKEQDEKAATILRPCVGRTSPCCGHECENQKEESKND